MSRDTHKKPRRLMQWSTLSLLSLAIQQAHAGCDLLLQAGDTQYLCDSGSSAGLTDYEGNNSLTLPVGGSGSITGDVVTGGGDDVLEMHSGTIDGKVIQGAGVDRVVITQGSVTGEIAQGDGIDDFVMHGGQIGSLSQGDNRDTFLMTDGVIVGAFLDGDVAKQTGGTIGRVDMKLDNNIYDMSGGSILGNLVTGFGTDTIIISGGTIGGNISVSGGNDSITVTGGVIAGEIRASTGDDTLNWSGGTIGGQILMGDGDDTASLTGLDEDQLGLTPSVDAGLGNDQLTFRNTTSANAARYIGWEQVDLSASQLRLEGDFFLGDEQTGQGVLTLDSASVLSVSTGSIRPYNKGGKAQLTNAGIIDLSTGSQRATDVLSVYGHYVGNNGQLKLQTVLGDDNSASDKLVVSGGSISGKTQLEVTNLNGSGGLTLDNGIQLVHASNGTTSTGDAFSLKNGSLSAGAYEYFLFKGGVNAGTENSWYLRSSIIALEPEPEPTPPPPPLVPDPEPPVVLPPPTLPEVDPDEPPVEPPTPQPPVPEEKPEPPKPEIPAVTAPEPAPTTPPLPPAGPDPIPLYRPEVPLYAVQIPAAQIISMYSLGTFHDRQGEQSLLSETGAVAAGWIRGFGRDFDRSWAGAALPSFDGSLTGLQVGHDLYSAANGSYERHRVGLFVGHSRLDGDVEGFSRGFKGQRAGTTKLTGDSLGAYWVWSATNGGYLDAVAMGTRIDGHTKSERGIKSDSKGDVWAVSLETGYPFAVSANWVLEPQLQLVYQQVNLDSQDDGIAKIAYDAQDYWTARLGARLKGQYVLRSTLLEPYLRLNGWHTFEGSASVTYDGLERLQTEHKSSSMDIGAGVVAHLSPHVSLYLSGDYNQHLDSNELEGVSGNLGIRISW